MYESDPSSFMGSESPQDWRAPSTSYGSTETSSSFSSGGTEAGSGYTTNSYTSQESSFNSGQSSDFYNPMETVSRYSNPAEPAPVEVASATGKFYESSKTSSDPFENPPPGRYVYGGVNLEHHYDGATSGERYAHFYTKEHKEENKKRGVIVYEIPQNSESMVPTLYEAVGAKTPEEKKVLYDAMKKASSNGLLNNDWFTHDCGGTLIVKSPKSNGWHEINIKRNPDKYYQGDYSFSFYVNIGNQSAKAEATPKPTSTPKESPRSKNTPMPEATSIPESTPMPEMVPTPEMTLEDSPILSDLSEELNHVYDLAEKSQEEEKMAPTPEATPTPEPPSKSEIAPTLESTPTPEKVPTPAPESTPTPEEKTPEYTEPETPYEILKKEEDMLPIVAEYAEHASAQTGVRPELLMALIKQETNFGRNIGTGNYKKDMRPREWANFLKICHDVGRDPERMPVSARPTNYKGWGGAMGFSQFMPSTWMEIAPKVCAVTGREYADPWNATDAFIATGLKLKELGADAGDPDSEWEAAGRYFAGRNFKNHPWYGDDIMKRAVAYGEWLKSKRS